MANYIPFVLLAVLSVAILSMFYMGSYEARPTSTVNDTAEEPKTVFEIAFVPVITQRRTASTRVLNELLDSTCFLSLGEIFQKSSGKNGGAWDNDPLSETFSASIRPQQYVDFFLRVAQKRCRSKIIHQGSSVNASAFCQGKCIVGFKEFNDNHSFDVQAGIWELLPNMTAIVLERDVEQQWKSYWFGVHGGGWDLKGEQSHKDAIANYDIPPVDKRYAEKHEAWYKFIREHLAEDRRIELTFDEAVAEGSKEMVRKKVNQALPLSFQGLLPGTNRSVRT